MEFLPELWILTGCTAVGKTALSLHLAKTLNAEVLSCDSVQVYRGTDIGSAKIAPEARQEIPHHGIDLRNPDEAFDVVQYVNHALFIVNEMQKKKKNLLIVGGTGFYLKSFFTSAADQLIISEKVRKELQIFYENCNLEALQRAVESYGPVDLNASDWHNPRRLIHILAKQRETGLPQIELKRKFLQKKCPFDKFHRKVILLERNPDSLKQRIGRRVDEMFQKGLLDEVKKIKNMGPNLAQAIGYREVRNFLQNPDKITENQLKESIVAATQRLVKKQRTWFRRQIPIDFSINLDAHSVQESFDLLDSFCSYGGK
jgi:tRNA dimethylallyltransferase